MHVAVVGAGLSGLMAAHALVERGHAVSVFEKSRAPGGRCATRHHDESSFDHGAQYFTHRDARLLPFMQQWRNQGLVAPWSATIAVRERGTWSVKTDTQTRWVAVPGMRSLGVQLASTLPVQYGVTVASLERREKSWRLVNGSGDPFGAFDRVVVTVPAPQTLALVAPHSQKLATRAAAIQMQPCIATMLVLDHRLAVDWDAAFVNDDSALSWVARNTSKPGRGTAECWVLHATPAWSAQHLERDPLELAPLMTHDFAGLVQQQLPVVQSVAHRWRYAIPQSKPESGPVGAAGSAVADTAPEAAPEAAPGAAYEAVYEAVYDAACGLAAAGDWCVGGRIEGALLSGMAAAELVQELS